MIKRILVPIDFSDSALQALDYAIELGRKLKPEFVVVHALEPVYYPGAGDMYGVYDMSFAYREIERAGREQLAHVASRLRRRRLAVRTLLLNGSAPHAIVEAAKKLKADLIVMSTHGRTGLAHVLMGSVAEGVVRNAACPVLTVRRQASTKRAPRRRARSKK
jgi:nucleotide-binding universal stress UspA family protein